MIKYILHYAPAKILPGLINFIGLTIYARIFTQEEYGRYAYVFATIGLIESIFFPWIRMSISRFYQKYNKRNLGYEYENFTLFIFTIVSLILIVCWIIFLTFTSVDSSLKSLYLFGLFVVLTQALLEQLMALARAKLQSKVFLFSMISKAVLKIVLVLMLVLLFNLNEKALFIGIIVAHLIPILFYLKNHVEFNKNYFNFNSRFVKETFHYGFPLTFTFLLTFIINSSDRIIIKHVLDNKSVGLYSIPYEFTTFTLTNVFMIFSLSFFPIIVKELEHNNIKQTINRIRQYSSILLTFTMPATIFIYVTAPEIAGLFLGDNYTSPEAIKIIQWISIAAFLAGLKAYFFDFAFQLGKNTYKQIIPVVIAAIVNVLANFILLPIMGVMGAVVGTIISYLIGIVLSIIIGYKLFPMKLPFKNTSKIIFVNILLLIILLSIKSDSSEWVRLITFTIVGSISYMLLMFTFNVINFRGLLLDKIKK